MLTATVTGTLVSTPAVDETGALFFNLNSAEARRSVRVHIMNAEQARLVLKLAKHDRLTVSGRLVATGAISPTGKACAHLKLYAQNLRIHPEVNYV